MYSVNLAGLILSNSLCVTDFTHGSQWMTVSLMWLSFLQMQWDSALLIVTTVTFHVSLKGRLTQITHHLVLDLSDQVFTY